MNTSKYWYYTALAVIIALGSFFWFRTKNATDEKELFSTARPTIKHLRKFVTATGTLKALDQLTVGSLLAGRVIEITADDNDIVKKGQLLTRLDNGIGDSAVKQLKATVDAQRARVAYQTQLYNRQKSLYETGQISQDFFELQTRDYRVALARLDQFEAELEIKEKEYDNLFIRAPDDGIVIARKVDLGQMITSVLQATELFIIAKDLTEMEAEINVDEADVGMVEEGQMVYFTVDSFPDRQFTGTVKQIEYLAREVDKVITYATLIDVPNPEKRLRPGMTTNIEILIKEDEHALSVQNRALRINKKALKRIAEQLTYEFKPLPQDTDKVNIPHVWLVENNTFKQQQVELGVTDRSFTQVTKGVSKESLILTDVSEPPQENMFLKQVFGGGAGGIGKK